MSQFRIAFDLDETLGVPLIANNQVPGFHLREGCLELLKELHLQHTLILWTVSSRNYLDRALTNELGAYFNETYSWDELACTWKDIRKVKADFLVDDCEHHKAVATKYGLDRHYIVIPAYGSAEDQHDPLLWVNLVRKALLF